jgi:hypothetical protein
MIPSILQIDGKNFRMVENAITLPPTRKKNLEHVMQTIAGTFLFWSCLFHSLGVSPILLFDEILRLQVEQQTDCFGPGYPPYILDPNQTRGNIE